jgi:hypothetical protein
MKPQEKRRSRRIRIGQPLKIRASDPKDQHVTETNITRNVSREGIYFVSHISSYQEGMRLFLSVPHHDPHQPQDREYLAQVVRLEKLEHGQWGVALQILSDITTKSAMR